MTQYDELLKKIEAMETEIARLKVAPPVIATKGQPTAQQVTRSDNPGEGGGWVVLTPNPAYSGELYGIRFDSGRAVVDVEIDNAAFIVTRMESDFGYDVHALNGADLSAFYKEMSKARRTGGDTRSMAEKLTQPMRA